MKPNPQFVALPKHFWANVRTISQHVGYTTRVTKRTTGLEKTARAIKIPSLAEIKGLKSLNVSVTRVTDTGIDVLKKKLPDCKIEK